ncbi:Pyridoxal-5'-phosphate-dependent protein beta subunit [Thermanaerovibrio acidaminovorans DSM 6589]|uniref:Pyridoxal-5'-phosphate-dependent protein beta subunit n=1 Tax=Thermanaerovibrio acidaminovorans (strain ATCC 49978 / DSM 6589 / Su883) TaxID=525903 RepID=D1B7E3_THEAS|nr:threonine/serine dehydratase [Thermanaerovibrio acidaminovorans]ACZ19934.1 Pyridoxal-5'-phosphate-dependent protein beta subunit [Thermanaerovibrio acidaminovorans DSM 6589]
MSTLPINPSMADALAAYRFLKDKVRHTPTELSRPLSGLTGAQVYIKWENQQLCGAFKVRGALFKMQSLSQEERRRGVVTASSGNHAQGVALASSLMGIKATICVPATCPKTKKEAIRGIGGHTVELRVVDGSYDDAEAEALAMAEREGMTFISAFEDHHVVCGAATVGIELMMDQPDLDVILVPAGGGGLMNGVALAACHLRPGIRVYGVQSEASNPYVVSWEDGVVRDVEYLPTLADGLAGYIPQSLLSLAKTRMAGVLEVTEQSIGRAMAFLLHHHHQVVEGSGAVGVAALLEGKLDPRGLKVGIVASGGNVDSSRLLEVLREHLQEV